MTIATQATLAALLAKTVATPATEGKQDTGNTSLATIATQTAGLATSAGQTSAGTKLDTLHTDLTSPLTTQNRGLTITGTLAALNAVVDGSTDLSGYNSVSMQISGTFNAQVWTEVSDDGVNWISRYLINSATNGPTNIQGAPNIGFGDIGGKYFRVKAGAYTSGTVNVTIVYSTASKPVSSTATQLASGTNAVGSVFIGAVTPSKITATSAATTNATSAKTSAGNLYEITVSNPSAAAVYLKLYNKASAPTVGTDVPVYTIPVAATSFICQPLGVTGKRFTTGIAWALTGAFAATDTTAVTAGVQIDGTYV